RGADQQRGLKAAEQTTTKLGVEQIRTRPRTNDPCWDHRNDERRARIDEEVSESRVIPSEVEESCSEILRSFCGILRLRSAPLGMTSPAKAMSFHLDVLPQIGWHVEIFAF